MDTSERIKYLRKDILHLNQEDFANKIGISRSNIGNIELGRVKLTERVAMDICKEFKINYLWLIEGKGPWKTETQDSIFEDLQKELDLDKNDIILLKEYASLDKEQRNQLFTYLKALIDAKKADKSMH